MKNFLRYGFLLMIICGIAAGVLAFTYENTQKVIALNKIKEKEKVLKELLPEASEFIKVSNIPKVKDSLVKIHEVYMGKNGNTKVGTVWEVSTQGYSSEIVALIALNSKKEIERIKIISQQETPGLGTEITKEDFLKQFSGKNEPNLEIKKNIIPVTGATISSSAVVRVVNEVLRNSEL